MTLKKTACAALAALFALPAAQVARADEGMWTFNNVPKAEIKRRYGFDVKDAWLKKVQQASVRFNSGGSGSFVSPDGLVMTNHHVASETLAKLSTPERDLLKTGFYARTRAEELKAPDLELNVLVDIEDVTARVNAAVKAEMSPGDANTARRAAIATIEKESLAASGLRSDVVTLYQGGQYNLYRYKKYTDVRIVFAPEFAVAFFGGDKDNFTFPRYCMDVTFVRVYENDKPLKVEHYFPWSKKGAKDGDLVFVPGHPGTTQRLNTVAHLEYLRDVYYPFTLRYLKREHDLLVKYGEQGPEQKRQAHEDLFGVDNSFKALTGHTQGLQDPAILGKKRKAEEDLRRAIAADAARQREYGDAWDAIAKARASLKAYDAERRLVEGNRESAAGFNTELFKIARKLVRLAAENARPNAERLTEYTDAGRASLELALYSPAPIYPELEKVKLADSLAFMRDELGADHPVVKKALDGKTPEARAAELVDGTRLRDVEVRRQLASGGAKAIEESTDPMIVLARSIDAEARALRKRYDDQVVSVERAGYAKVARAVFDVEGTKVYPDATFTLRISYGAVKGYQEDGRPVPTFTQMAGMFARSAEAGNQDPYQLPERWLKAKSTLDLKTPFNFVSTNDIIGGNSGSPVIDKNAEIVGLVFDSNIQGLVGSFVYDEAQNRTVSVDSRGMVEAMRKIYGAKELVDELTR